MVRGGLSSVSYRNSSPAEVIAVAREAGLDGIEWTADTHVPLGDVENAEAVMMATLKARLTVCSYGSFFRLGSAAEDFSEVLDTTRRLQAPTLRIWGCSAEDASKKSLQKHASDSMVLADAAGKLGITIVLEPHERTFIKGYDVLAEILEAADHPFLKACWTRLPGLDAEACATGVESLAAHLALAHIKNWTPGYDRLPIDSSGCCREAVSRMRENYRGSALDRWALIEYLSDEDPETLKREATALKTLLA